MAGNDLKESHKVVNVVRGKKDSREIIDVLNLNKENSVLGLYFSAHWCPPCRAFTPKLAEWYTSLTSGPLKGKLEIVFVSSDRDEEAFDEYFDTMPWIALPFDNRDAKKSLCDKHEIRGIPTLVLLDGKTGNVISKNGRSIVGSDPNGARFPWKNE